MMIPDTPTPFAVEKSEEEGFFSFSWQTFKATLFKPKQFFSQLDPQGSLRRPLSYWILFNLIGSFFISAQVLLFTQGELKKGAGLAPGNDWGPFLFAIFAGFLLICLLLLLTNGIFTGWFHLLLRWRKGTSYPFRSSFRVLCFSSSPYFLFAIPIVGIWLGGLWSTILFLFGIKTIHQTSWTRVITTWIMANALFGFVIFAGVFLAGYFRQYFL